jgi:uncharacterized membrane protein
MMPSHMQPPDNTVTVPPAVEATRWIAVASVLGLIVLQLAWHLWLPAKPSLWVVKALPLCLPMAGLLKRQMYTYRWTSLLVWLYVLDGVMSVAESPLAAIEIALSVILFVACGLHVRIRLRNAKP